MNSNQLMTGAAVAFGGFALWYITRTPGGQVAKQPGQAQRDAGLISFWDATNAQFAAIPSTSGTYKFNSPDFQKLLWGTQP